MWKSWDCNISKASPRAWSPSGTSLQILPLLLGLARCSITHRPPLGLGAHIGELGASLIKLVVGQCGMLLFSLHWNWMLQKQQERQWKVGCVGSRHPMQLLLNPRRNSKLKRKNEARKITCGYECLLVTSSGFVTHFSLLLQPIGQIRRTFYITICILAIACSIQCSVVLILIKHQIHPL